MTVTVRRERLRRNLDALATAAAERDEVVRELTRVLPVRIGLERLRRNLDHALATAGAGRDPFGRPRAAVIAWDLTHNPVGRALVLHDLLAPEWEVDLIGPMWQAMGTSLWAPAVGEFERVRSFSAVSVADYLPAAVATATSGRYDVVVASKYRLPSLYLATLVAEWNGAPLVVDIDDLESSLAQPTEQGPADTMEDLFDGPARRLEERSVEVADALTTVSAPLGDRFGGVTVRHARSRSVPCDSVVATERRRSTRARFGIPDDETAVFFIGTVRPHKGVQEVVAALRELDRDDVRLHVFTTTPLAEVATLVEDIAGEHANRWVHHGHCRLRDVPALLTGADVVVLAQDPDSPISAYQVPAKISDAAAVGCPVLAPDLPAYSDLASAGLVVTYPPGGLVEALAAIADNPRDVGAARARQGAFAEELSLTVNSARLASAIGAATDAQTSRDPGVSAVLHDEVLDLYERKRRFVPDDLPMDLEGGKPGYDIAFFWKQNDSDLYGRRSDMTVRHAAAQGRLRSGVHFDAPVAASSLATLVGAGGGLPRQADFELAGIVERHLRLRDDRALARRTFLHAEPDHPAARLFGRSVPSSAAYAEFILTELDDAGLDPARTIAWIWPVAPLLGDVLEHVGFGAVVCDLVDDQRTWPHLDDDARLRLTESYRSVVDVADLVVTNSEANAAAFADFGREITVVPNGAEPGPGRPGPGRSAADRPTVGYVGDMQDRIDWDLVEAIADARPDWDMVLVGEVPDASPAHGLVARCPNLRLAGVVPYAEARDLMQGFDVGIVPHVLSEQSMRMDPLKVYNYLAMGLPVVSTARPSAFIHDDRVDVASTPTDFVAKLAERLGEPRGREGSVDGFSWSERVTTMFELVDGLPGANAWRTP